MCIRDSINIDEFDQVSSTQQGFLKHILQKPVLNVKKPHGSAVLEMRRSVSYTHLDVYKRQRMGRIVW